MAKKIKLKLNEYHIISRAVEEGIRIGWNRAHKHTDTPSSGPIQDSIENEVMNALGEIIKWPEM